MADPIHQMIPPLLIALADQLDAAPPPSLSAFAAMLSPLFDDVGWVSALVDRALTRWRDFPTGDVALRGFGVGPVSGVVLVERSTVGMTLGFLDSLFDTGAADSQLVFDDSFSLTIVLAGGPVTVDRVDLSGKGGCIDHSRRLHLHAGDRILLDHSLSQLNLVALAYNAVFLRIGCACANAAPTANVYDGKTGLPVKQVCTDIAASRMLALLDVAASSGRGDKPAIIGGLTRHRLPALRWQAARHWLVSDPEAAYPAITAMAASDADPSIRAAASATCAMIEALQAPTGPC